MKNLIFGIFFWLLFLLFINSMSNRINEKRIIQLEKKTANYEYEIFKLKKDIEYMKNPYLEAF